MLLAGPVVVVAAAVPPVAAVELVDKVVCAGPASVLGADGDGVSEVTGPGAVGTTSVVAAVDATLVLVLPVTVAVDSTTEVDWAVVVAVPLLGKGTGATVGLATQSDGMRMETSVMVTVASAAARWKSARAPAATA